MKIVKIFGVLFPLAFCGCSAELEGDQTLGHDESVLNSTHRITEPRAGEIAEAVLGGTRAGEKLSVDYIISSRQVKSRSVEGLDTLAYIFNRGCDNGFVLVSVDDRVKPVLAFSETGSFSLEGAHYKMVDDNFLSRLESYYQNASESDATYDFSDDFLSSCVICRPQTSRSWSQENPYDKYVVIEHPGCPVGCVAVAVGQIIANCKLDLDYHNENYDFYSINYALYDSETAESPFEFISNRQITEYTEDEAIDKLAKLLYWIGSDVGMSYQVGGSSAYSSRAWQLVKSLGLEVTSYPLNYTDTDVMNYLLQNYVIYVDGRWVSNTSSGHAYIIDGGYFCWDNVDLQGNTISGAERTMKDIYVHVDWGMGGEYNGYYCGDVFEVNDYFSYGYMRYFAAKKERPLTLKPTI